MSKKIATLWDKSAEPEDDDPQAYYAGGSESGQEILNPNHLIENLFSHAATMDSPDNASSVPIVFWRDGFTVGDSQELRDYNSPENRQFMESLKRGETPPELARKGIVNVKLEKKVNQDFKPDRKFQAFSGEGHRLGAPCPEVTRKQ